MQISRLFNFLSNFQLRYLDIFYLSFYLIPNLINVLLPFIVIFGFVIAFIKFDKDKEIVAIYSLGLSIKEIRKPILFFSILIIVFYLFLNFLISPLIYDIYKKKEFNLRNFVDINNLNITNFIEVDENLILDFKKNDGFEDIFIRYQDENENIIYSKKANIIRQNKKIIFNLFDGFKISIKNNEVEKLKFESYKFDFPLKNQIEEYSNFDKNSLTLFKLIELKKFEIIYERIFETFLIISLIIFFYFNNIKKNNFGLLKVIEYLIISVLMLILQNISKNISVDNKILFLFNIIIILSIYVYIFIQKKKT